MEQSVVINNETGSNSRYRWTVEVVEDKEKKLIWQRKDGGERSFSGAQIHCNKLSLDEVDNWRVPKFKELSELLKGEFATEIFGKISRGFIGRLTLQELRFLIRGKVQAELRFWEDTTLCVLEICWIH